MVQIRDIIIGAHGINLALLVILSLNVKIFYNYYLSNCKVFCIQKKIINSHKQFKVTLPFIDHTRNDIHCEDFC